MSTSTIQEDIVFLTWLDCHQIPVYIPKIDFFQSLTRNRNDAFLVTLPMTLINFSSSNTSLFFRFTSSETRRPQENRVSIIALLRCPSHFSKSIAASSMSTSSTDKYSGKCFPIWEKPIIRSDRLLYNHQAPDTGRKNGFRSKSELVNEQKHHDHANLQKNSPSLPISFLSAPNCSYQHTPRENSSHGNRHPTYFGEITPQLEVSHIVLYNFIPHFCQFP